MVYTKKFLFKKISYKNKIIASKIVYCNTLFKKGSGLMFRSKHSVKNTAWFFSFKNPQRISVTMFFVFFPIDIVFLDKNNKIIEIKENFKPFTNYTCNTKAFAFIELESGAVKKYGLKLEEILTFT